MSFELLLILSIVAVALGVVTAIVSAVAHQQWSTRKKIGWRVIAALVVLAGIGGLVSARLAYRPEPPTPEPTTAEPSTPEPTTAEPSTPEPTTAEPSTPEATSPANNSPSPSERQYYLADLPPLHEEKEDRPGNCTDGCTGFGAGAARIAGVTYPRSYLLEVAADGRRSTAVWSLARSCTELNMIVGLDDDGSPMTQVAFTLSVDGGQPTELATVGQAEPSEPISESVVGVGQIEIAAYVSGPEAPDSVPIVLGDAWVTCEPGSLGDS